MACILIVDDSWLMRNTLKVMLSSHGYETVEAVNGADGLAKMSECLPDCILLDLVMPDLDGFQFLRICQEQNIKIPAIVLTADIQDTTRVKCVALGAKTLLKKPPQEEIVMEAINQALLSRQAGA